MPDQIEPLAPFRALADQYAAKAAEAARNAEASTMADARLAQQGIAAGWQSAEFLLRHTLADLGNSAASDGTTADDRRYWTSRYGQEPT
ncbi:hypothetical protein N4G70_29070 [Streptomyces sp. ASQP_92]|uniref:hypothetical protein n=1 Tax=Streptomyces sp. ASQP_92 TaxID=2979116 RepID=UPI0021BE1B85|nr:hypothetical protein [Streptomyces sp. ASQP_92]MCT9092893.1 hypothetical protein [Streptomyces sp. ASQP_92]